MSKVVYKYMRYTVRGEDDDYTNVPDAIRRMSHDMDYEQAWPLEITEDGETVMRFNEDAPPPSDEETFLFFGPRAAEYEELWAALNRDDE